MTLAEHLASAPFELILSSGFFGFFAHAGVVRALEEHSLRPAAVGGSSAGALVAGLWGAGVASERLQARLFTLRRDDFWDPDPFVGLRPGARPGLLRGLRFERLLREALAGVGVARFSECPLPVRMVAWDVARRSKVVLAAGELAPAIRASCSVPGLFQPTEIDGRHYLDGGIADRPGIAAATVGARVVYHHLPAKSPWRRFTPSQNRPPAWDDLHVLCEPRLPRLSPFHLARGPEAYEMARSMALRALDGRLPGGA
ncbi:MAG: patatin [Myxococcales bacterium]|nr:patatin [Myxococcales bacterium]